MDSHLNHDTSDSRKSILGNGADTFKQQVQSHVGDVNGNEDSYDIEKCRKDGFISMHSVEPREDDRRRKTNPALLPSTASSASVPLMALNTTKAGMEGLDVETINKIITEASEGSKFYEHKKRQQEKIDKRIEEMKLSYQKLTPDQIDRAQVQVDKLVSEIEANMSFSRYYVHLDMDAFFASVEMRDDPSLRDIPMAVGSESMLSTSNYVARRFGVRAAMPGFIARKLCPQLRIIPCNFRKYEEASKTVEQIIQKYDQNLFMCMDEADLDITDYLFEYDRTHPNEESNVYTIAEEIRRAIEQGTNLTASAGIAPTRFLAKMCSDIKKPNGQCMLENTKQAVQSFLSAVPIRKVCGIGAVTEQMLKALDVHTCKDLWQKRAVLSLLFKRATFQNLLGIAMGTGSSVFRDLTTDSGGRKSLSCERTFIGTSDLSFLENLCKSLCSEVEKDLKAANLTCKTITLKIKTTEYEVKTRARSIIQRTDSAHKIFEASWKIFMSYVNEISDLTIRLMGVRVSNLEEISGSAKDMGAQRSMHQFLVDPNTIGDRNSTITSCCVDDKSTLYCKMNCPVCNVQVQALTFNEAERLMDIHIDECLSKTKLKEVRTELTASSSASPKKRLASSAAFNGAKKQKRASELPIDAFFQKL